MVYQKNLKIRKPTEKDIYELELLFQVTRQKSFVNRPSEAFQIGDYKKSTAEDDVLLAEENGVIIGFVSTYTTDNFIHNLFVHPDYQGRNIGTQLLQMAEQRLVRPMTLKIAIDNLSVRYFYEKYGWYQVSIQDNADEPYYLYQKD